MSKLYIGDKQILPEKLETVTGYTINATYVTVSPNNKILAHKVGSVVQIQADFSAGVNIPAQAAVILVSGLPKTHDFVDLQITPDLRPSQYSRSWVDYNGNLLVYVDPAYTGNIYIGGTYITTD